MIELLAGLSHAIAAGLHVMGRSIRWLGLISSLFMRDSFRAHYNLIAQYTAPFEHEILGLTPPSPRNLNLYGQIVLLPLNALAWVLALTLGPVLYNGTLLLVSFFARNYNLALFDLPERQITMPDIRLSWYRVLYGTGGLTAGIFLGLTFTVGIALLRTLINSGESAWLTFKRVSLAAQGSDVDALVADDRAWYLIYGFGLPGLVLGGLAGLVGFSTLGAWRVLKESTLTAWHVAKRMTNSVLPDGQESVLLRRDGFKRFVLGFPGVLPGIVMGLVSMTAVIAARITANSWFSFGISFTRLVNLVLDSADELKLDDAIEASPKKQKYGFGLPGLVAGTLIGLPALASVAIGRVFINSCRTAFAMMVSAGHVGLHSKRALQMGLERDTRLRRHTFGLGFPGLLAGSLLASAAFLAAVLIRIVRESSYTTSNVAGNMINRTRLKPASAVEPSPRSVLNRILGAPGLITGLLSGAVGVTVIIIGRVVSNSWFSAAIGFSKVVNLALDAEDEITLHENITAVPASEKYGFGLPGMVLGGLAGFPGSAAVLLARTISNTTLTAFAMTVSAAYFALHGTAPEQLGLETDTRSRLRKYVLGLPGLFIGAFSASMGFLLTGLYRSLRESAYTTSSISRQMVNVVRPGLPDNETAAQLNPAAPQRSVLNRILGAPGVLTGVVLGLLGMATVGFGRGVVNSWFSIAIGFTRVVNLILEPEDRLHPDEVITSAPRAEKYGFGLPGIIIGGLAGIPAFFTVLFARVIGNASHTAFGMTVSAGHFALRGTAAQRLGLETDNRPVGRKYILGFPGLFAGALTATAGFLLVALFRSLRESVKSLVDINRFMLKAVLPTPAARPTENTDDNTPGPRSLVNRLLGTPGLILGLPSGVISMLAVVMARTIANSWFNFALGFTRVTNLGLDAADTMILSEEIEHTPALQKYGFGLPGLILGGLAGIPALASVVMGRIIGHSALTAFGMIVSAGHFALHGSYPVALGLETDFRPRLHKFGLGLPGLLFGSLPASGAFIAAVLIRIIRESSKTTGYIAGRMTNLVRTQLPAATEEETAAPAPRSRLNLILGAPGVITGLLSGFIGMGAVTIGRSLVNSWYSSAISFAALVNLSLAPEDKIALSRSITEVPAIDKYGFGFMGLVAGALTGVPAATSIVFGRIIINSWFSMAISFSRVVNLALAPEDRMNLAESITSAPAIQKYGFGFPGIAIGGLAGLAGLLAVYSSRVLYHSARSWASLSGSFINGSLKQPVFDGLGGDTRAVSWKLAGFSGYVAAMLTTFPVSILIVTAKTLTPMLFAFFAGLSVSPLVAALKWLNMGVTAPRFAREPETDPTVGKFRNLYSSLDAWGQFPQQGDILEHQDGRKGPLCFTRKAITFNVSTFTEQTLNTLLQAWRDTAADQREQFFAEGGIFDQAVLGVKDHYRVLSCLEFAATIADREAQIDAVAAFVKDYLNDLHPPMPERFYNQQSWSAVFWGGRKTREGYQPIADADQVELPSPLAS